MLCGVDVVVGVFVVCRVFVDGEVEDEGVDGFGGLVEDVEGIFLFGVIEEVFMGQKMFGSDGVVIIDRFERKGCQLYVLEIGVVGVGSIDGDIGGMYFVENGFNVVLQFDFIDIRSELSLYEEYESIFVKWEDELVVVFIVVGVRWGILYVEVDSREEIVGGDSVVGYEVEVSSGVFLQFGISFDNDRSDDIKGVCVEMRRLVKIFVERRLRVR